MIVQFFADFVIAHKMSAFRFNFQTSGQFLVMSILNTGFSSFFSECSSFLIATAQIQYPSIIIKDQRQHPYRCYGFLKMLTHILKQLIVDFSCFFILASIRVSKPNLIDNCDFISCILVMIFVPRLFSKRLGTVGTACAASQADSVSKIKDLLAGYDVLRFFGKDERFTSGVDAASDSMEQAKYKLTINKDGIGCGLAYVSAVCQVAVVILLGVLILNDMIPLATFMGTGTICAGVYNGLNQVSKLAVSFSASKPYFDKITIHAGEAQLPDFGLPTLQEGITVKDVSFGYDEKKPILVHMNAEFKKGGKYALTGPSGCGKSTLLKILLGWLPGYQGKVLYDERDVRDYTPEQLQQKMSYIEQNVFLFNTTIRENITLGEHFTDEQMEKALRDSALAGDLANMPKGLDTPVGEEGNALSGGQKQRVAIARALIHNRSILLVDEGTSALDQKNADIVEKSLLSNPDLTLILISHHLSDERKAQFDHVYELTPASSIV